MESVADYNSGQQEETGSMWAGSSCRGDGPVLGFMRSPDAFRPPLLQGRGSEFGGSVKGETLSAANLERHDFLCTGRVAMPPKELRCQLETELAKERVKVADAVMNRAEAVIASGMLLTS
jgi:hypothetical protein